jgi:hypothetical protein
MANATIKITQLPPGNTISASTILPIVGVNGTPTTQQVAVGNIANFTLLNAGNTLPPAYLANLSYNVVNAAQPNITSVGNLTRLTITNLSNFNLPGGVSGQVLTTDGSGNLSWGNSSAGGLPGGLANYIQYNSGSNTFSGSSSFTFDSANNKVNTTNLEVTTNFTTVNSNITGSLSANSVIITGTSNTKNIIANGNVTANFFIGDGSQLTNITANSSANANFAAYAGNVTVSSQSNITSLGNLTGLQSNGTVFINNNTQSTSNATGALRVTGGIGVTGNIHSGNEIHSKGNVIVGGQSLFVGPSADATGLINPTLVIFHGGDQYIQAALKNSLANGSADWVAYGDNGTESQGWTDMGFTSSNFNDANYTITGPGDGYVFVETFAGSYGGNLVLATGDLGTTKDIIFATNGFLTENEFGRISDANNSLELTRANATITFPDGSIQTSAYTGGEAAGSNNEIQFNSNGAFDSSSNLKFTDTVSGGTIEVGSELNLLGNGTIGTTGSNLLLQPAGNIIMQASSYYLTFDIAGNLTLPGNTVAINFANGTSAFGNIVGTNLDGNTGNILYGNGVFAAAPSGYGNSNVSTFLASYGSNTITTSGNITAGNLIGSLANGNSNVTITTAAGNVVTNVNGALALTVSASGIKVSGGGALQSPGGATSITLNNNGANIPTANITTQLNVTGASGANITGNSTTGIGAINAGVSTTPLPNTIVSFTSNVNYYTQITLQNKNTGIDATADYILTADNGSDTVNYLDLGIINSGYDANTPTNSLGNIVYAADGYLYAQGNTGNANQSGGNLVLGTTVPGKNVKIFAGGVNSSSIIANISNTGIAVNGNVTANNFSGNISITGNITGTSPNVTLVAGSYSYTFDNSGTLTLPTGPAGDEGGEIAFTQAANSTLAGNTVVLDQYADRIRFFEGGGNARGVYIDMTQAADGVSTLLNNRVSGLVNAGTFVTMDLIKATVTTSGNRGLSLAATTGSFNINISGTYGGVGGSSGSAGTGTINTTPSTSQFGWNFTSQAEGSTYIITDTTNNRAYRITLQIGASFNNNMISIERLV